MNDEAFVAMFNGIVGIVMILIALRFTYTLSLPSQRRALRLLLFAGGFFVVTEFLSGANHLWLGGILSEQTIALLDEASDLTVIIFFGLVFYLLNRSDRSEVALLRLSADVDRMTGLYNYNFFQRAATRRIHEARDYGLPLACFMIDVDDFKDYNDRYGHQAGNGALQCVAKVLRGASRANDLTARYGGEEFVMLVAEGPEEAAALAERICSVVESECTHERRGSTLRRPLTVSVGVAFLSGRTETLEDLVEAADDQMYHAKRAGKNRTASEGFGPE